CRQYHAVGAEPAADPVVRADPQTAGILSLSDHLRYFDCRCVRRVRQPVRLLDAGGLRPARLRDAAAGLSVGAADPRPGARRFDGTCVAPVIDDVAGRPWHTG